MDIKILDFYEKVAVWMALRSGCLAGYPDSIGIPRLFDRQALHAYTVLGAQTLR